MSKTYRSLRVLISHSSKDQPIARALYHQLNAEGWMDVWFIESNLLPSQNWDLEIREAVKSADVVIVLLAKNLAKREAYFYPDPGFVFDILKTKAKKKVFVIPLRLDISNIPPASPKASEPIDYFPKSQRRLVYPQLLESLRSYAKHYGFSMDRRTHDLESEQGFQWSPIFWKEHGGSVEEAIVEPSLEQKLTRTPSILKQNIFSRENNLFYVAVTASVLAVVLVGILAINSVAAPFTAREPTFVSLPTPTLGVGSARISPQDGMQMVYVPEGEFMVGGDVYFDEKPIHSVTLEAYWIDQTEVTNAMFAVFLNQWGNQEEGGVAWLDSKDDDVRIHFEEGFWRADRAYQDHPVAEVTWYGASAYCSWAGRRLPTEAEWEKAARGIDGNIFPWGNKKPTPDLLNFNNNFGDTTKVGSYPQGASPFGALDMAGNVWEWVADRYSRSYYSNSPSDNPMGPDEGFFRVLRGGGWNSRDTYIRSVHRNRGAPVISHDFLGFRCASSEK